MLMVVVKVEQELYKKTHKYPFKRYNMLCAICADKVVGWKLYKDITGG